MLIWSPVAKGLIWHACTKYSVVSLKVQRAILECWKTDELWSFLEGGAFREDMVVLSPVPIPSPSVPLHRHLCKVYIDRKAYLSSVGRGIRFEEGVIGTP